MLATLVACAPPAAFGRISAMLGTSVDLVLVPAQALTQNFTIQASSEWADRVYVELPDLNFALHSSVMGELFRVLKKGGSVCIRHRKADDSKNAWPSNLIFAGFVDTTENDGDGVMVETSAIKPPWEVGSAVPLSIKRSKQEAQETKKVWKVSADEDDEIMDEDSLLSEKDLKAAPKPASDCELSGGRKACKNCTCGRAEMEENGGKAAAAAPTSACGNRLGCDFENCCAQCYLGDAFRCASCPYKGLPPFKPGERVTVSTD
ncbi:hypothetical protein GUITHDRAFT_85491 [Guillardia theta CCMP2712]|uniref:Anamorsin homolog n=1 Tax=Guillardia theta (strain CCMP2712) TaxID=905079 RepID=L1JNK9_GUITC|nr:hypothetical protein GUITHDRAFT_85491 [Guillardia theta CCMP2712]EKX49849.1 hypothetical protein GUITHDRAFT_85491 [Guillardia theta CCMP2712]|eukprot:XP_005836829.1 hypothetical protein GUITHDRAFT_85491 [Guillardia theta CCMP2712]